MAASVDNEDQLAVTFCSSTGTQSNDRFRPKTALLQTLGGKVHGRNYMAVGQASLIVELSHL